MAHCWKSHVTARILSGREEGINSLNCLFYKDLNKTLLNDGQTTGHDNNKIRSYDFETSA